MKDYIVSVMARDRVGIVRDVSSALAELGGNITHLSQTVLRGHFTLIISVEMPDSRTESEIRQGIQRKGAIGELEVGVRAYSETHPPITGRAERFTLSMQGKDCPGIIAKTTAYLADKGINIEDFYSYVREGTLLMLAQVSIPLEVNAEETRIGLEKVGEEYGLTVHLQHENIFRATSEIRSVGTLERNHTI